MVTPPPSNFFFLLPDADNEEAVRRKTCCVAFRLTNTSRSFLTTVSLKSFLPHLQERSRRIALPVIGCEIIDVSSHLPLPPRLPPPPPPAQAN